MARPESVHFAMRAAGESWLHSGRSALVEVPSAIVPETSNWLLNPAHPDARGVTIVRAEKFPYDQRLFRAGALAE